LPGSERVPPRRRLAENSFPPFEGLVRDIEEQGFVFRYD